MDQESDPFKSQIRNQDPKPNLGSKPKFSLVGEVGEAGESRIHFHPYMHSLEHNNWSQSYTHSPEHINYTSTFQKLFDLVHAAVNGLMQTHETKQSLHASISHHDYYAHLFLMTSWTFPLEWYEWAPNKFDESLTIGLI